MLGILAPPGKCRECGKQTDYHTSVARDGRRILESGPTYFFWAERTWDPYQGFVRARIDFCSAACATAYANWDYKRQAILQGPPLK